MIAHKRAAIAAATTIIALGLGGGIALAATSGSGGGFQEIACVHFGQPGSAAGNTMDYDYNDSACPAGTYRVHLAQFPDVDPAATVTVTATPSASPSASASSSATPSASATH